MSARGDHCEDCGAPLAPELGGACPACLWGEDDGDVAASDLEFGEEIARGGMGAVYRARHESDEVDVALKVLGAMQPGMEHTFDLEVQAMARLNHPSIAMVVDAGRLDDEAARSLRVLPSSPWIARASAPASVSGAGRAK